MTSQNETKNSITWSRTKKNLARIIRNCIPPFLHKPLGWVDATDNQQPDPDTNSAGLEEQVDVQFDLPVAPPDQIWSGFDQMPIIMFPRQIRQHLWAMPENELMVLSSICQVLKPQIVFEFGTFTGASTLAIAANSAPNVRVHTLDIAPEDRKTHRTGVGSDIPFEFEIGQAFKGTLWESQITIHTCDARQLDVSNYQQQMDLVFIDADHTYSFVKNDTQKALEMLKPGGVILWHDYRWDDVSPECAGVTRMVNEFHKEVGGCREIDGTRFAIYQSPSSLQQRAAA